MNKNKAIFILVVLLIIGGIWGSLADRKKIVLEKKLQETVEQMQKLTDQNSRQREQVLGKTAELQETLAAREVQLDKARKELVSLRKEIKVLESQLSACNAAIQKLTEERDALRSGLPEQEVLPAEGKTGKDDGAEPDSAKGKPEEVQGEQVGEAQKNRETEVQSLLEQLQAAELTIDRLRQQLDAEKAQMMGLEKLLEEKNSAMNETSRKMDRLKINMEVLLSKIGDQRDALQQIQEEKRNLVKELAARNEEVAALREELMRQPVRE
ncbi:MAG: hypothetical protein M8357_09300 [Desulfobulbaceae bacterium]|nr:hypothetical protein [Desulfobulbaceae bacterium]